MKLIIPMAGRGTRLRPHSHVTPKPLLNLKGKSAVERIVDTFNHVLSHHLDEGIFVLGPDFGADVRRQLTDMCERHDMQAHFVVQEVAQGTAHATYCAEAFLEGEGLVAFADTLFDMEAGVDTEGVDVVAFVKHVDDPSHYGVAVRNGDQITAFVEKPQELISNEALVGIYYLKDLSLLKHAIEYLIDNDVRGYKDEFQLTDAFDRMLKVGHLFKTVSVTEWWDCGNLNTFMNATRLILDKEQDDLRHGEVIDSIIHDPVYIGPGAKVTGSIVGPYVSVEEGAEITNSIVRDSIVFAHAHVENAVLADSFVGAHAQISLPARAVNIGDHSVLE